MLHREKGTKYYKLLAYQCCYSTDVKEKQFQSKWYPVVANGMQAMIKNTDISGAENILVHNPYLKERRILVHNPYLKERR